MRLHYDTSIPSDPAPLVLTREDGKRVELHLRPDEAGLFTLLAFAGENELPERSTSQGPFYRLDQAIGARRAIAGSLLSDGYRVESERHPIWQLQAQKSINTLRASHENNPVDYRFDPKDVFLDW